MGKLAIKDKSGDRKKSLKPTASKVKNDELVSQVDSIQPDNLELVGTTTGKASAPVEVAQNAQIVEEDFFSDLAMPEITCGNVVPEVVSQVGYTLSKKLVCDTEYDIQGDATQVLDVRLKQYQEMSFAKHSDITYRSPKIKLSESPYGMRLKNMTGVNAVPVQFTPGFVSKIVPLSLIDNPELICQPEAFLAATDPGLRIEDERRPGFAPYKALRGTGVVFLKSVGIALFQNLMKNESCIAKTPHVIAFQTFCDLRDRSVEHPDPPSCFGKKAPLFPHMRIEGPGLVMLSPIFPGAKVIPISLEEYPNLWIKEHVFMAASDSEVFIEPRRIKRGKETLNKGDIFFSLTGKGVVFLNVTGAFKFQVLKPLETLLTSVESVVAFQGTCTVSQEKGTDSQKNFQDLLVMGPGLVSLQPLSSEGRRPERWGYAKLKPEKVVPKTKNQVEKESGCTPARPLPERRKSSGCA